MDVNCGSMIISKALANLCLFIVSLLLLNHLNRVAGSEVTPLWDLCDDGMVDTAIRTIDGRIYIFKGSHYFIWSADLRQPLPPAKPISDWLTLPAGIHASLTITDKFNRLYGNSFFFKGTTWYQYVNQSFIQSGGTSNWVVDPVYAKYIIPMYNESLAGFFSLPEPRFVLGDTTLFQWYNFHTPFNPSHLTSGSLVSHYFSIDLLSVRAIVDFPDNRWLVFFDDETFGHFCVLDNPSGDCKAQFIWDTETCPDLLNQFIEDSVFLLAIEKLPYNLNRFFSVISAILITVAIIQAILITGLLVIIDDFLKIKNRAKLFQLLLERQKYSTGHPYVSFGRYLLRTLETSFNQID